VLWATPRTVSTAFERMIIERGDHEVVDEPFSVPYYFGPDRRSTRFAAEAGAPDGPEVIDQLVARAATAAVFVKDMAYHAAPWVDPTFLERGTHTFLIRDPARALPSLARVWPDFTDDEAGYRAQGDLFDRARDRGEVVVIDSDDLRADPAAVVAAWCEHMGIPFVADALTWSPGMQVEWVRWREWYRATAASTGFLPPDADDPPPLDTPRLRQAVERCRPIYERLHTHRLRP
jgi:hypothetical protein